MLLAAGPAAAEEVDDAGVDQPPAAERYQLGHGFALGDSGFRLGGYGVAGARETTGEPDWEAAIESLSAFVWWDGDSAWRFFAELEIEDVLIARPGEISTTDDLELLVERLHVDYAWRDAAKLRLGKFLTPVGRWNLIHAAPLVWTSSRPLITESTFPTNATGAMVYGLLETPVGSVDYSLYASPGEELFRVDDEETFNEAYGGHVGLSPVPTFKIGLSFVDFELADDNNQRRKLYAGDFHWSYNRFELTGEYAYRVTSLRQGSGDEHGGYLQFVAPLTEKLYGVARYEQFENSGTDSNLELYLAGLTYRWKPAVVLKGEYSDAQENDIGFVDGWRASIAVLF